MSDDICLSRATPELSKLPNEILNLIIHNLEFPKTATLRAICRHFRSLVP